MGAMPGEVDPFLGRSDVLGRLEDLPCKANWLAARHRYVESQYGKAGVDDVVRRLDDVHRRAFLEPPPTMSWSNVGIVVTIDRAIFTGPMDGSLRRMRHFGAEIAKYDVPGVYRVFFRLGTPGFMVGKLPLVYRQYFRRGAMQATVERGQAEIKLVDVTFPAYLCEHGISGWFDAMLELVGARAPRVEHAKCVHRGDPHCAWQATWLA